jgi:hypothetical protein
MNRCAWIAINQCAWKAITGAQECGSAAPWTERSRLSPREHHFLRHCRNQTMSHRSYIPDTRAVKHLALHRDNRKIINELPPDEKISLIARAKTASLSGAPQRCTPASE